MKTCCLEDFEDIAREHLPAAAYDYFAGGSCDEVTLRDNRDAFGRVRLLGRVLRDVSGRTLSTTVLGCPVSMPVMIAPVAMQRLAHDDGELATARAAAESGTLMIMSTLATASIEEISAAADGPRWFQLYIYKDRGLTAELVRRAEASGAKAIVLTVDGQVWGRRYRDVRSGFSLPPGMKLANFSAVGLDRFPDAPESGLAAYVTSLLDPSLDWNDVAELAAMTSLPIVLKGILHADDARLAVAHGAAGVFVSNHGGRQLDGAPATMDVLESVVDAVDGRAEVYLDGGVRRGTDVIKAIALGARAVAVGRPVVWALAAGGHRGVKRMLAMLRDECDIAMALCGAANPDALERSLVV
ncbi:MAG TPA: alpha-hydroxy acid oxidase [Candidatus Limnocylindrales bacterium]|nr:alpha-hydroxy acid oxidase [Candidatus Limnocylindrales bacterium]